MTFELTRHAKDVIEERNIPVEYIERVLNYAELTLDDPVDIELEHRLMKIPEYGNRVLRVVMNKNSEPSRVITAYFDRSMRGKL